jgi:TfoX/Sxy family transcriptional regulator of competence genes
MAVNENLLRRVRASLVHIPRVQEKKMFAGITFMVNGKMCISVGPDRIMCRIDPAMHEKALKRKGARTVLMKGREYRGFVYVNEEAIKNKKDLDYWIALSLDFNKRAKASAKRKKKS